MCGSARAGGGGRVHPVGPQLLYCSRSARTWRQSVSSSRIPERASPCERACGPPAAKRTTQRAGLHMLLQAMGQAVLHNLLKCFVFEAVTHPRESLQRLMSQIFSTKSLQRISPESHVSYSFHNITPVTRLSDTPHKNTPEKHTTEILQRHIFDLLAFCL